MESPNEYLPQLMSSLADSYQSMFLKVGGIPQPKIVFNRPLEQHTPLVVRALRAGDAMLMLSELVGADASISSSQALLRAGMRDAAICALYLDSQAGVQTEAKLRTWAGCSSRIDLIASKAEDGVLSRALVTHLYESKDPNGHVWTPLKDAMTKLLNAGETEALATIAKGLPAFEDDNDLAVIFATAQKPILDRAFEAPIDAERLSAADVAYMLHQAECAIMGNESMLNGAQDLLDYEASYRAKTSADQRVSAPRLG